MEHEGQLPEPVIAKYMAQIAIALKYMKDEKIIHRDIKPKNILVHKGNIKISDFGVAKMINDHNFDKETTTFSGTYQFMSPQILRQDKYTYQTDIWSLGITLYYMIFKKHPWTTSKVLGILKEIEQGIVLPEDHTISGELNDLLTRMLIESEEERITAEQMLKHEFLREAVATQYE